jgi:PhzF family phenazine biosynthesis protein
MRTRVYQVDAFARRPFQGNPAAVCLLAEPRNEPWMQNVAQEMNLSETAFIRPLTPGEFELRWFTPAVEVELCGHATLAAAHVLWETEILAADEPARFRTKGGLLTATRSGDEIELNFPATPPRETQTPDGLLDALGIDTAHVAKTQFDYLVEVDSESVVRTLAPDVRRLGMLCVRGVIVTAKAEGTEFDFISRFFAPSAGVDEDPVTGSAHCALAPYWSEKLGKDKLVGYQASARGGVVRVRVSGNRVVLSGHAVTVLRGELCDL